MNILNDYDGSVSMLLIDMFFTNWILSFQNFQVEHYMK